MNAERFARIKAAFERNGGIIDQSKEAQRLLKYHEAEAIQSRLNRLLMIN